MRTAALALVCVASLGAQGLEAPRVTVADIEKAWREREEAFQEVEVEWEEELHIVKGSISRMMAISAMDEKHLKSMNPDGSAIPSEDAIIPVKGLMRVTGATMLLERNEAQWVPSRKRLEPTVTRDVYDGKVARNFRPGGLGDASYPQGMIVPSKVFLMAGSTRYRPLCFAVRPLAPAYRQIPLLDLVFTGRSLTVNGSSCYEAVRTPGGKGAPTVTYWLDASKGHSIIRHTIHHAGRVMQQTDIDYIPRGGHWGPVAWRITTNDFQGKPDTYCSATVTSWKETTGKPPDEVVFPAGARVLDARQPPLKAFTVATPEGHLASMNLNQARKPHEEVVEEVLAQDARSRRLWSMWVWGIVSVSVLAAALIVWSVRRRVAKSVS